MKFRLLHQAMMRLSDLHELDATYNTYGYGGWGTPSRRAQIESVAHELAHCLCLQGNPMASTSVGDTIRLLDAYQADQQEFWSLRIEVTALRMLGISFDLFALAKKANFRNEKPPEWSLREPLSSLERKQVDRFIEIVEESAKALS